jgi:hypothetical protein
MEEKKLKVSEILTTPSMLSKYPRIAEIAFYYYQL